MYLVRIKKAHPPFIKDGVYLFDAENVKKVPDSYGEKYPYDNIQLYTNQKNLFIVRSGGIGDLMAYSILHDIAPNVTVLTQEKYRPFMKLWKTPPTFKHPGQPILIAKSWTDLENKLKDWGRLSGIEDEIELGSKECWYDIINRAANRPSVRRRPELIEPSGEQIKGCLIVSKASVVDRTADSTAIVKAVTPYFKHIVLAHEQDWTAQQFITALMRYEYVISTDTSAVHIREGLGLPALGLYGPFVKECRTDGYLFTKSIQIDSGCTPCQRHSRIPCQYNQGTKYAPCLTGDRMIQQIQEQVEHFISETKPTN